MAVRSSDAAGAAVPIPRYPAIADYALVSDCHCCALVSRFGSIDWCCMPRLDDDSCFGRILDWDKGGHCSIAPHAGPYDSSRRYVDGTMMLETCLRSAEGEVRVTDFFAMDGNAPQQTPYDLVRIVDGLAGEVVLRIEVHPRFDYGEIIPQVQQRAPRVYSATGSDQGLIIDTDAELEVVGRAGLAGLVRVPAGRRVRLGIQFVPPERLEQDCRQRQDVQVLDRFLETTRRWWTGWSRKMHERMPVDQHTERSLIVLKALTFEPTGAIAAAPTASLPEWIGGGRNWDYRFCWVRDSVFTIRALHELGYAVEADRFHRFIQRTAAGSAEQLQIMYGVQGKRRLTEIELAWLEGYRGSRPVRIGNGAAKQSQLDIYGELLEMAWEWHCSGHRTEPEYWRFLSDVIENVILRWRRPDHGIWEVRGEPRHYVHSKVMCWAALHRGVQLADAAGLPAPRDRWQEERDAMRAAIEREGYDGRAGVFVRAFGRQDLDASLLLLPAVGFVAYDDPRMLRTVAAICAELDRDGLLLRYLGPDGLDGPEGMFLPCTFWLAACLARQGERERARQYYDRALACGNELGLFSEEYDMRGREMLGNFPQGLTHVSQVMAWLALQGK